MKKKIELDFICEKCGHKGQAKIIIMTTGKKEMEEVN